MPVDYSPIDGKLIIPFELFFQKPTDLLNVAFAPLEQLTKTQEVYLQLLKEKAKFITVILFTINTIDGSLIVAMLLHFRV